MAHFDLIDQPGRLRDEDRLDLAALQSYLQRVYPQRGDAPQVQQFRGGASNLTYQLSWPDLDLILRTSPPGVKAKSAHNMAREFQIMQALKPHYPYVPTMIDLCQDESVLGREFYLMEKVRGIIPRANLPEGLNLSATEVRQLCLSVIDKLIELHQLDLPTTGLAAFGKGEGYAQRQIEGWSRRYRKAKTWQVPGFEPVMRWLGDNLPTDGQRCFIHNDFRFDNVVLNPKQPTKVIGVLDWEMATVGDPRMDLGNSLAYWVQADDDWFFKLFRRQPTHLPGMLTRQEVIDYYCEKMGLQAGTFTFFEVYGLFRLAVIVQQIYFRYHHRQIRNPAFRWFWLLAHYLNRRCRRLIAQTR